MTNHWGRLLGSLSLALMLIAAGGSEQALVDAAKNSDIDALRTLIEEGADVNVRSGDGSTALLWASYRDDLESADLLIHAGADVNLANDLGATPIWAASRNASADMADKLLTAGATPDSRLSLGETPLVTASRTGSAEVVRMLLEKGAEVNARGARGQTPLMFAVAQRHPRVVKVLLEHGADVHATSDVWTQLMAQSPHAHPEHQSVVSHGGNTALMFAARAGELESAKLLVASGADVDAPSAWGTTPLALATYGDFGARFLIREQTFRSLVYFERDQVLPGQFAEVVEFLLEQGADPNAGAHRFTPLIAALLHQNEKTVELLLAHGADPNLPLGDFTPLQRGSTTDFFLHKSWVGATPLWLTARFSTPAIVRRLLEHGADPLFVHHGVYYGGSPGGNMSQRQEEITTTLMGAVQMGTGRAWTVLEPDEAMVLETVKLLIEAGVDVNTVGDLPPARSRRGPLPQGTQIGPAAPILCGQCREPLPSVGLRTALEGAKDLGYDSVVEYLLGRGATGD